MNDRRNLLKIKLKSLAAEAKIIKAAEQKLQLPTWLRVDESDRKVTPVTYSKEAHEKDPVAVAEAAKGIRLLIRKNRAASRAKPWYDENRAMLDELKAHRRFIVGPAARATHLAYGFLRGKTLGQLEGNRHWLRELSPGDRLGHQYNVDAPVYRDAMRLIYTYAGFVQRNEKQMEFQSWLLSTGFVTRDHVPETEEERRAREAKLREKSMNERLNPPPAFPVGP